MAQVNSDELDKFLNEQLINAQKENDYHNAKGEFNEIIARKAILDIYEDFISNAFLELIKKMLIKYRVNILLHGKDSKINGYIRFATDEQKENYKDQKYVFDKNTLIINPDAFHVSVFDDELYNKEVHADFYQRIRNFFESYNLLSEKDNKKLSIAASYNDLKYAYTMEMKYCEEERKKIEELLEDYYGQSNTPKI